MAPRADIGRRAEKTKRITFHEITKDAIMEALKNPRMLDMKQVDAQQARRILDRLVGYKLSPFLWTKVRRGLSAGRVQSVAVRLIVDREREITAFVPQEYWSIEGVFASPKNETFDAKLHSLSGKTLDKMALKSKADADALLGDLRSVSYSVTSVETKDKKASPPPPFTTSTLQQEANRRLGFSAKQTMTIAQKLYEGVDIGEEGAVGLITYMRTDSVNMADKFLTEANDFITKEYGAKYALESPRKYKTKSKGAQEAHEAIRPTDPSRDPDLLVSSLDPGQLKLYKLIWQRALATQMQDAKLLGTSVDITGGNAMFRATGQQVAFDGYLKLYPDQDKDKFLPELAEKDAIKTQEIEGKQHFTEPAARYSDATLVKALEELGIGRPSTYAPTISTVIDRGYVERDEKKRLLPTDIGYEVTDLLVANFPDIVDFEFTARMENSLDNIAEGRMDWRPLISAFYGPFKITLDKREKDLAAEAEKKPRA